MQVPRVGVPDVWHKPLGPQGRGSGSARAFPSVCHCTRSEGFGETMSLPFLPSHCALLSLVVEEDVKLVFGSFSAGVIP